MFLFFKENQLTQQEQIRGKYELINLTRVGTTENCKLLWKLNEELIEWNASFTTLSRETIMLMYYKNLSWLCYNCEERFQYCKIV